MKSTISPILLPFAALWFLSYSGPIAFAQSATSYRSGIRQWHEERIADLKAPQGWLSLAGLFWLEEGEDTFGSGKDNKVVFPGGGPERMGSFLKRGDSVWVEMAPGVEALFEGKPVSRMLVFPGNAILHAGRFSWTVIQRGDKTGVRLWDTQHPALGAFDHIEHYPVRKKWRIKAEFIPHPEPRILRIPNILGMNVPQRSPGIVRFRFQGKPHQLIALEESPETLFLIFADETTGVETYGGGRYLSAPVPGPDRKTVVDFNKAYNPPCVFTPFATCLLPPAENKLKLAIHAGEKNYGAH